MTNTFRISAAALAAALLTACGGDTVVQPAFGSACTVGSLSAGREVTASFDRDNCVLDYHFWSGNRVSYASYSVSLAKGKGYYFFASAVPDDSGAISGRRILTLYGKDANGQSTPLAVSAWDAGGPNDAAEFFFISPRSGTFNLVVSDYSDTDEGDYLVSMDQCPVLGIMDTVGTYDYVLPSSPCVRRNMAFQGFASQIALVGVKVQPLFRHTVNVQTTAFSPYLEMGGPDFDVFDNLFDDSDYGSRGGVGSLSNWMYEGTDGMLTLAVGSSFFGERGAFTAQLTRTAIVVPIMAQQAEPGVARRNLGLPRPVLR